MSNQCGVPLGGQARGRGRGTGDVRQQSFGGGRGHVSVPSLGHSSSSSGSGARPSSSSVSTSSRGRNQSDTDMLPLTSPVVGPPRGLLPTTTARQFAPIDFVRGEPDDWQQFGDRGDPPGAGPSRGAPPCVGPSRGVPPGAGPSRGVPPGAGPSRGVPPGAGSSRGVPPGAGPSRGVPPGAGPSRGVPPGVAPSRGAPPGVALSRVSILCNGGSSRDSPSGYGGPSRGGPSGNGGSSRGGPSGNGGPSRGGPSGNGGSYRGGPSGNGGSYRGGPSGSGGSYRGGGGNGASGSGGPPRVGSRAGAAGASDRGAVRGKRTITTDIVHSRPVNATTKTGSSGTKVTVVANYFRVLKKPEWTIFQYRVDFSPDVDSARLRRGYINDHKDFLGGYIFDGTVLFCTTKFATPSGKNNILELTSQSRAGDIILIKIKYVGCVESADSQQFQVLNLILRRAMEGLNLQLVSRNFFDPKGMIALNNYRMEIWPGYQTSIRQHEHDILLCTEIAHKVMRTDSLYTIFSDCLRDHSDAQDAFKKDVMGMIVLTDYNNKTYRIDDVDFQSSPLSTFPTKDGDVSYVEYYKRRYNLTIRDYKQPLLVSRPTEKNIRGGHDQLIMLIPELSRATGMTDSMRSNVRLMKTMSEHTRLTPDRRIERLRVFNNRLQTSEQSTEVLNNWSMKIDSNLVEIPARILEPEKIVFANNARYVCDVRADWTTEFRRRAMFTHTNIKRWYVVVPRRVLRDTQNFVKMCINAANGMKMHISEPRYQETDDERNGTYSSAIDIAASVDPQILMVVLIAPNEEKYSCIKKRTCVDRPIPSQVVTIKTIAPRPERQAGLMSIATKVVIQMNAKLMGSPWMIEIPLRGLMTVGFDVCHSSKNKNKSFGALVATMDLKTSGRYFSAVGEHMKGQELSNEMGVNMSYALKAFRDHHDSLPERILFFRDGVGDGQLFQVVNTEVKYLKNKLDQLYRDYGHLDGCRMTFIVVAKRINTRYFLKKRNPPPGTVVDDIITLPERFDFFLVSQSVCQGTVSPTNYNVIHDSMGLGADKLQILAYKMTHMYYNYSGTCRVPAVCQYAHKLAFLIAENINRTPSPGLENQLYFL